VIERETERERARVQKEGRKGSYQRERGKEQEKTRGGGRGGERECVKEFERWVVSFYESY